jgi:AcrR family transcriptional regulator
MSNPPDARPTPAPPAQRAPAERAPAERAVAERAVAERAATERPAHRPSKRASVVAAAIRVFAERGFADAGIPEVAAAADLAPTGVYYHFATKDELFDAVIRQVYSEVDAVTELARPYAQAGGPDALRAVISAVWDWAAAHPEQATILYQQMPDATPASRVMRQEHEQRHVERAYAYLDDDSSQPARASAAESHAAATLTVRALIRFEMAALAAISAGGGLATYAAGVVRQEVERVSERLLFGA